MTKPLTITDHLGLKLAATFHEPATPGPHPLVILLHGFSGRKEEGHIVSLAEDLAAAGIAALRFDASGSGQSEGTWAEHYRVSNYLADVSDVLEYAKTHLPVDPARIAIWGHSMGGLVALTAAVRSPGQFIAACGSQPASGPKAVTAEEDEAWRRTGWHTVHSRGHGDFELPYAYVTDRLQYNLLAEISALKMPLLLLGGTTDTLVPAAGVKQIFAAAPEPKTYLEYNIGHDYKHHPEMLAKMNADTLKFFEKYLLSI
jgi:alpha-beta hydrolase superfamily lysophospholipase